MSSLASSDWQRRGFLKGLACCTALPMAACRRQGSDEKVPVEAYVWSGIGFGIGMSMELFGVDRVLGESLGQRCQQEIAALENAFSLYLENSELSRLNRERVLRQPSPLFRDLLTRAIDLESRTLGFYQPAIHGAWQWLAAHQYRIDARDQAEWQRHGAAADGRYIEQAADGSIRLTHPLTQLSMNAIGQGYLADRVAQLLEGAGVKHALLHLGETYAIGHHPDGRMWKLAVMGTAVDGETDLVGEMEFADAGLAVSANEATRVLIDPVGACLQQRDRVAAVVSGEGAAIADAFATAFAVAPRERWEALAVELKRLGQSQVKVWESNQLAFSA